ncbi:MAG: hypothetical protein WB626_09020 [Bacteroidota bacterium]
MSGRALTLTAVAAILLGLPLALLLRRRCRARRPADRGNPDLLYDTGDLMA